MKLNQRFAGEALSPTLALNAKAKDMAAAGRKVVNLTTGEPDFVTPDRILDAARAAIDKGRTFYTAAAGIPELRAAVLRRVEEAHGLKFAPGEVIVTAGAKQALFSACLAVLSEGDEAVIIAPYWVSYPAMVRMAGGRPVFVRAEESDGFVPRLDAVEAALSDRTRLVFVNSPCNPSGAVFGESFLRDLAALLASHPDVVVICDDVYENLIYDGCGFFSVATAGKLAPSQIALISGVSKSYAMTGWRIGYLLGPRDLVDAVLSIQSQSVSNATSISQYAALEALSGDQSDVKGMREVFEGRRNAFFDLVSSIPQIRCHKPGGAFYLFPSVKAFLGTRQPDGRVVGDDVELAEYLLEDGGVAVVPGSAFGSPGHIRLSFAASLRNLEEGASRMRNSLSRLSVGKGF